MNITMQLTFTYSENGEIKESIKIVKGSLSSLEKRMDVATKEVLNKSGREFIKLDAIQL